MSFWSPMIVGILASRSSLGASIAGYVYGLSTLGNVAGTLATAFLFVPALGSSTIAMVFRYGLFLISILLVISRAIRNRPL
jgi:predicted membrane-bound spermidine synthase